MTGLCTQPPAIRPARYLALLTVVAALLHAACVGNNDHVREFVAFGTLVSVSIYGADEQQAANAIGQLERRFAELGTAWYPKADGELKAANAAIAQGKPAHVSSELKSLLQDAARYEQLAGGLFNVCLGNLSQLWGFYDLPASPASLPDPATLAAVLASNPSATQLSWQGLELSSSNPHVMLDIGAIAKGAILNIAARELKTAGLENAIVNIGGDLIVLGDVHGRDANIGIRDPSGGRPVASLQVANGEAVFTSGNYERYVDIDGQRYTHILDPATGYPVQHTASVTVVHEDPVLADAAATALLVGGAPQFDRLVAAFALRDALLIPARGDARLTAHMAARLHWQEPDHQEPALD
ncbi:MAG TPA: FAD:protein FMN transferase [Woeseiaceae bacterium]|nr:FAD:protein FMN transferase [Woeseiaceae bacterium]